MKDYKKDFPIFSENDNLTYLDSAASSLRPQVVIRKMEEYYKKYGVNIHRGMYKLGYAATQEYEDSRKVVASFIGAKEDEIFFVRNATEGLNVISKMLLAKLASGDHVLTTPLEHHSSILPWMRLEKDMGIVLDYIDLDDVGRIGLENVKKAINKDTKILAITYASNTMGYVTDIKPIIEYAHKMSVIVIVDAAQIVAHRKIDVKDLDCDFLVFSGHKMLGPTGIGVVYGKYSVLNTLDPVNYGGDMNASVDFHNVTLLECPHKFEAGTPAIAEAIGLKEAIKYLESIGFSEIEKREEELKDYLFERIKEVEGIEVYNTNPDLGILLFNVKGIHPHDASSMYDTENICLRAGHHCAELVSRKLGIIGSLRASLYFYNTKEDIDRFIECTKKTVKFFKEIGG